MNVVEGDVGKFTALFWTLFEAKCGGMLVLFSAWATLQTAPHTQANASVAAQLIADVIQRLGDTCPEAPEFILGDFNHCVLDKTLRSYEQYVTCATTQKNTVTDLCYGSVNGAYRSMPMTSLGASYHNSVYLMLVYTPAFRRLD